MPTIEDRFKIRRGTASDLASVNEVPLKGEFVYETDQGLADGKYKLKIGDGVTHYNDLAYLQLGGGVETVVPGDGVDVDSTDPKNPVISSTLGSISPDGRVPDYASLPSTGLSSGDTYYVESDGLFYIWNGSAFPVQGNGASIAQRRVVKQADESRSNTTSATNDSELGLYLAPGTYAIRLMAFIVTASTTPKFKLAIAFTGAATGQRHLEFGNGAGVVVGGTSGFITTSDISPGVAAAPGTWPSGTSYWRDEIAIKVTTAGVLTIQWGPQVSSASVVTVKAGSVLEVL